MRHFVPTVIATLMAASPALAMEQAGEQSTAIRPAPSSAAAEMSTGIEYQKGKYGTAQKVETLSIPTSVRLSTGRVQFTATLPYLRIDAPGNVVGGGGGVLGLPIIVDPTRPATRDRREGMGDLRLGAAYSVPSSSLGLTFSGQMKVPTASERKRLGTGEIDYMMGVELSKSFAGITPFASVAYTIPGNPEGYDLRDSISARAGLAVQIGERVRGHISYGYAQSLSRLVPDEQHISTGINAGLSGRLSLGLYGSAGLSHGAPEVGAGVQLGLRLF